MGSGGRPVTAINCSKASAQQLSPRHPEASAVLLALLSSLVGGTLESTTKKLISKRPRSTKDDTDHTSSVKISRLPSISESGSSSFTNIIARKESPWEIYEKVLDLDLNGSVTVAQRKARHSGLVAVRAFPVAAAENALYMHGRVRHANIVEALDAFTTETSLFIVLEHMPISLDQIVQCVKYPTERQLAAMCIISDPTIWDLGLKANEAIEVLDTVIFSSSSVVVWTLCFWGLYICMLFLPITSL